MLTCRNCDPHEPCFIPDKYPVYQVDQYAFFSGEENMMQEIYQRGPIACGVDSTSELHNYTGGIFIDQTGAVDINHEISVVGFGVENGTKYWLVRNSWGQAWGDNGFFKIIRGVNNLAIESECTWAVPKDTWTNPVMHTTTD